MKHTTKCPNCGKRIAGLGSLFERNFELTNVGIQCPHCGHNEMVRDGIYSIIDGVIKAFAAPGMTRENVEEAQRVAEDAAKGEISFEDAVARLEIVSKSLAQAVKQGSSSLVSWDRIIAILALLHAFWIAHSSDADVQAALTESRKQTELSQRMLEEMRKRPAIGYTEKPTPVRPIATQAQMTSPKNRHERRKASSIAARKKDRPER